MSCSECWICCCTSDLEHRQLYDRGLSQLFHDDLHWLEKCCGRLRLSADSSTNVHVPRWLLRLGLRRCQSPSYVHCRCQSTDCTTRSSQHVWSRVFASASPTVWNSLPEFLRGHSCWHHQFWRDLKTFLFDQL